ncbi:MAG: DUF559 domain-containing protein [Acidimicrobiia bacterium]
MKYDKVIRDLARSQQMVVARRQLSAAGVDYRAINNRIRSGLLEPVTNRVLRYSGAPGSEAQRLMIALLHIGPETYVSHMTAAAWWGIAGFRLDRIHISVERVYRTDDSSRQITVHHSTVIPDWCRKVHNGIPVLSPGLAIYQLAGTISGDRVARALDNAWSLRLINGQLLDDLIARLGRSGRNGTTLMRELREERNGDWIPPASNVESRFEELTKPHGFRFRRQVDIGDENWSGRVDFLAEDCPLIVEVLSERFHVSLTDREIDEARRARHTAMGFLVVEVWDHEIFYTPWVVIARLNEARKVLLSRSPRVDRQ